MWEIVDFKARGWHCDPYDVPIDEPHHNLRNEYRDIDIFGFII